MKVIIPNNQDRALVVKALNEFISRRKETAATTATSAMTPRESEMLSAEILVSDIISTHGD